MDGGLFSMRRNVSSADLLACATSLARTLVLATPSPAVCRFLNNGTQPGWVGDVVPDLSCEVTGSGGVSLQGSSGTLLVDGLLNITGGPLQMFAGSLVGSGEIVAAGGGSLGLGCVGGASCPHSHGVATFTVRGLLEITQPTSYSVAPGNLFQVAKGGTLWVHGVGASLHLLQGGGEISSQNPCPYLQANPGLFVVLEGGRLNVTQAGLFNSQLPVQILAQGAAVVADASSMMSIHPPLFNPPSNGLASSLVVEGTLTQASLGTLVLHETGLGAQVVGSAGQWIVGTGCTANVSTPLSVSQGGVVVVHGILVALAANSISSQGTVQVVGPQGTLLLTGESSSLHLVDSSATLAFQSLAAQLRLSAGATLVSQGSLLLHSLDSLTLQQGSSIQVGGTGSCVDGLPSSILLSGGSSIAIAPSAGACSSSATPPLQGGNVTLQSSGSTFLYGGSPTLHLQAVHLMSSPSASQWFGTMSWPPSTPLAAAIAEWPSVPHASLGPFDNAASPGQIRVTSLQVDSPQSTVLVGEQGLVITGHVSIAGGVNSTWIGAGNCTMSGGTHISGPDTTLSLQGGVSWIVPATGSLLVQGSMTMELTQSGSQVAILGSTFTHEVGSLQIAFSGGSSVSASQGGIISWQGTSVQLLSTSTPDSTLPACSIGISDASSQLSLAASSALSSVGCSWMVDASATLQVQGLVLFIFFPLTSLSTPVCLMLPHSIHARICVPLLQTRGVIF